MPNPVVRFVIQGPDLAVLRQFYGQAFGWELYDIVPTYVAIEAAPHEHDEHGNDITPPIVFQARGGALAWRYEGERGLRYLSPGTDGGLSTGQPRVYVCIEVEDLTTAIANVERAGGTVVSPPRHIPQFTSVAQIADPAGNVVELQQQRPMA
jgi:predicted enzyme related to lactoylglutathione lyase